MSTFTTIGEFRQESRRTPLVTARVTQALLRKPGILEVRLDDKVELLTSSRERQEHFATTDVAWLQQALQDWEDGANEVKIASPQHPIEFLTGDAVATLVVEGKEYLAHIYRDIDPMGWLFPGGCSDTLAELLNPQSIPSRELREELLLGNTSGQAFLLGTTLRTSLDALEMWRMNRNNAISLEAHEIPLHSRFAQKAHVLYRGAENTLSGAFTIDPALGSIGFFKGWRFDIPIPFSELRLFDGEVLPDGRLLNRAIRLMNSSGSVVAHFLHGRNLSQEGWVGEGAENQTEKWLQLR